VTDFAKHKPCFEYRTRLSLRRRVELSTWRESLRAASGFDGRARGMKGRAREAAPPFGRRRKRKARA